jgi:hypothetical protein
MPENQSFNFTVIMLKHESMLATLRYQMRISLARRCNLQRSENQFSAARGRSFARFLGFRRGGPLLPSINWAQEYGQSGPAIAFPRSGP